MTEFWKGESAEKKYLIDPESGYFRALEFARDPVSLLETYKLDHFDNGGTEDDVGILAIEYIRELCHVIQNEQIQIESDYAKALIEAEDLSPEWAKSTFVLLKASAFTKACIKTWLLLDEDFNDVNDEFNSSRILNRYLDEVYQD